MLENSSFSPLHFVWRSAPAHGAPVLISIWNFTKTRLMGLLYGESCIILTSTDFDWGYRGGIPTGVQPWQPCPCGSRPLVTPYYCRLGDLLCFVFMSAYCMFDLSVYCLFLQASVLWYWWLGLFTNRPTVLVGT